MVPISSSLAVGGIGKALDADAQPVGESGAALAGYLDTLRWVFIAVAFGGIAVTIYGRLDDWRRGRR